MSNIEKYPSGTLSMKSISTTHAGTIVVSQSIAYEGAVCITVREQGGEDATVWLGRDECMALMSMLMENHLHPYTDFPEF